MFSLDPIGQAMLGTWPPMVVALARLGAFLGEGGTYLVPSGLALVGLALVAVPAGRFDAGCRQIWLRLFFFFTAVAGSGIAVNVLKRLIGRARPLHVDEFPPLKFDPITWSAKFASMPSGHATTAAALCVTAGLLLGRRARLVALVLAAVICASRVILGAHFVSDVLAGLLFGWLYTWWYARFLARRGLVFREEPSGMLSLRGTRSSACWRRLMQGGRPIRT
jgi:undecaprenyl-diphosphatase